MPQFDANVSIVVYEATAHVGELLIDLQIGVADEHYVVIAHLNLIVRFVVVVFFVEPF